MPKPLTTEEIVHRFLHPEEMTLEESEVASNRAADIYQRTVYECIVAERYREKKDSLPAARRKEALRRLGREITFDGCECVREISGGQRVSGTSRFFEFKFSGFTPGAKPAPDMRIRLRMVSGIERFVLYQGHSEGHSGNRVAVEIDMEAHMGREMKLLDGGDIIEFLLPYRIGGKAIKRFRYIFEDAWYLPPDRQPVFEALDGNFRDTLPEWKAHLFWIAKRGRDDISLYGRHFSAGDKKRAGGAPAQGKMTLAAAQTAHSLMHQVRQKKRNASTR